MSLLQQAQVVVGLILASVGSAARESGETEAAGNPTQEAPVFASTRNWPHDYTACPGILVKWNLLDGRTTLWSADDDRTQIQHLEIDPIDDRLYGASRCEGSNFDLTGRQVVVMPYTGCAAPAVDPVCRNYYWLDRIDETYVIRRVNLDGAAPEDIGTAPIAYTGFSPFFDLEVDPSGQEIFRFVWCSDAKVDTRVGGDSCVA